MKKYYVYVYLNPLVIGKFCYQDLSFGYKPFYVGKGKGSRWKVHTDIARRGWNDSNQIKTNEISSILAAGQNPIVVFLKKDLTEKQALSLEIQTIARIGRADEKNGPLLNLTSGGDTPAHLNKVSRQKMSLVKMGKTLSKETKLRMSKAHQGKNNHFFGKHHSDKTKELISKSRKGKRAGIEHPMYGRTHSLEARLRISEAHRKIRGEFHPRSREYSVTSPDGKWYYFCGAFAKNCLALGVKSPSLLLHVAQGKRHDYKGWKCKYLD